jgi:hypothetical protein
MNLKKNGVRVWTGPICFGIGIRRNFVCELPGCVQHMEYLDQISYQLFKKDFAKCIWNEHPRYGFGQKARRGQSKNWRPLSVTTNLGEDNFVVALISYKN